MEGSSTGASNNKMHDSESKYSSVSSSVHKNLIDQCAFTETEMAQMKNNQEEILTEETDQ